MVSPKEIRHSETENLLPNLPPIPPKRKDIPEKMSSLPLPTALPEAKNPDLKGHTIVEKDEKEDEPESGFWGNLWNNTKKVAVDWGVKACGVGDAEIVQEGNKLAAEIDMLSGSTHLTKTLDLLTPSLINLLHGYLITKNQKVLADYVSDPETGYPRVKALVRILLFQGVVNLIDGEKNEDERLKSSNPDIKEAAAVEFTIAQLTKLVEPLTEFDKTYSQLRLEKDKDPKAYEVGLEKAFQVMTKGIFSILFKNGENDLHLPPVVLWALNKFKGINFDKLQNEIFPGMASLYFSAVVDVADEIVPVRLQEEMEKHADLANLSQALSNGILDMSPQVVGNIKILKGYKYHFLNELCMKGLTNPENNKEIDGLKDVAKKYLMERIFSYLLLLQEDDQLTLTEVAKKELQEMDNLAGKDETATQKLMKILFDLVNENKLTDGTMKPIEDALDSFSLAKREELAACRASLAVLGPDQLGPVGPYLEMPKAELESRIEKLKIRITAAKKFKSIIQDMVVPQIQNVDVAFKAINQHGEECVRLIEKVPFGGQEAIPFVQQISEMLTLLISAKLKDVLISETKDREKFKKLLKEKHIHVEDSLVDTIFVQFGLIVEGPSFNGLVRSNLENAFYHMLSHVIEQDKTGSYASMHLGAYTVEGLVKIFDERFPSLHKKCVAVQSAIKLMRSQQPKYNPDTIYPILEGVLEKNELLKFLESLSDYSEKAEGTTTAQLEEDLILLVLRNDVAAVLKEVGVSEEVYTKNIGEIIKGTLIEKDPKKVEDSRAVFSVFISALYSHVLKLFTLNFVYEYYDEMSTPLQLGKPILANNPKLMDLIHKASPLLAKAVRTGLSDDEVQQSMWEDFLSTPDRTGSTKAKDRAKVGGEWLKDGVKPFMDGSGHENIWENVDAYVEDIVKHFTARTFNVAPHLGQRSGGLNGHELNDPHAYFKILTMFFHKVVKERAKAYARGEKEPPIDRKEFYQGLSDKIWEVLSTKFDPNDKKERAMPVPGDFQSNVQSLWKNKGADLLETLMQPYMDPLGRSKMVSSWLLSVNYNLGYDYYKINSYKFEPPGARPELKNFPNEIEYKKALGKYNTSVKRSKGIVAKLIRRTLRNSLKSVIGSYWEWFKAHKTQWIEENVEFKWVKGFSDTIDRASEAMFLKFIFPFTKVAFFPITIFENAAERKLANRIADFVTKDEMERWCQEAVLMAFEDVISPDFKKKTETMFDESKIKERLKKKHPERFKDKEPTAEEMAEELYAEDLADVLTTFSNMKVDGKPWLNGMTLFPIKRIFGSKKCASWLSAMLSKKTVVNSRGTSPAEMIFQGVIDGLTPVA